MFFSPHSPENIFSSAMTSCRNGKLCWQNWQKASKGIRQGNASRWGQKSWQTPPPASQSPGPRSESRKMRYGKEGRKEVKKEWKQSDIICLLVEEHNPVYERKWNSLSHVQLFPTPWTIQSMEFSRPEAGNLSHLQGIFPTQGSNPGLPHCRRILYQLSHRGSPGILE